MKLELALWLTRTKYPEAIGTMFQETTMPLDMGKATTPVTGTRPVSVEESELEGRGEVREKGRGMGEM